MASLGRETKKGYVVNVKEKGLGLTTSFQSFKTTGREAKATVARFDANVAKVKNGELEFDQLWDSKTKLIYLRTGMLPPKSVEQKKEVKLGSSVERFLEEKKSAGKTFNTISGYKIELNHAIKHFKKDAVISTISKKCIQDWIWKQGKTKITTGKHVGKKTSRATIQKRVDRFEQLFRWLYSYGEISFDPSPLFSSLQFPQEDSEYDRLEEWQTLGDRLATIKKLGYSLGDRLSYERVFFSAEETARLLSITREKLYDNGNADSRRLYVALVFAAYTSARRSEIPRVRRCDIDLEEGVVTLLLRKGRGKKTYRYHNFPLHDSLKELLALHLKEMPENKQALFTLSDSHLVGRDFDQEKESYASGYLSKCLARALKGTEFELCSGWHIHRHSLVSLMLDKGIDAETAMELVGHKTRDVHLRYRHVLETKKRAAFDKLNSDAA